jgi:mycothiol synthase
MLWPERLLSAPPSVDLPDGYALRVFRPGEDDARHRDLMHAVGFTDWDEVALQTWLNRVLPDGLFVVEHCATGELVATAMASHNPTPLHPFGGELGWVAGSNRHTGRGLGRAVCAAVVRRFLSAGYRRIYLLTDDWRLPALSIYLRLGFEPFLYAPDMAERWQTVYEKVGWAGTEMVR